MFNLSSGVFVSQSSTQKKLLFQRNIQFVEVSRYICIRNLPYVNAKLIMQDSNSMKYVVVITSWYVTVNTSYCSQNMEDRCGLDQLEKPDCSASRAQLDDLQEVDVSVVGQLTLHWGQAMIGYFLSSEAGDEIRFESSQEMMIEGCGGGDLRVCGLIKTVELHSA